MGWWHRCFVLPQRSKADQHQFLCSPLAWAFSISCFVICSTTPGLGQGLLVTKEPHRQAGNRGVSFSKSQTPATAAGMAKKPKEKKEASVCSSFSDAELVSHMMSPALGKVDIMWLGKTKAGTQKTHPAKRESRSCHCSLVLPLPSQKEMTEAFRIRVSGSWEVLRVG